ncbi:MAG: efflux RND transporter periplasmic adaptor subunit [Candidatus Cloacimonetes bacterium]|nr:efflux RND transporter periplasmic adaptor subunit [Candidatus Cloacimonadota bacterium]MCA9786388.1 efflux RND transporter periplasmic adaptor subunit [Candidatus Cloacimonadota bacterium]
MMRIPARRVLPLLALGLVLAGCGSHDGSGGTESLPEVRASLVSVDGSPVTRMLEVSGMVQPRQQSALMGRSSGPVTAIHVSPGDRVAKGQLLLEIEKDMNEGMLHQAEGALAQAKAAFTLAEQNHQRFSRLFEKNACSQLELDAALMQRDQAAGAVTQASGAVASARSVSDETDVRAPFAGRVVDTMVEIGDLAAPGRPLVMLHSLEGNEFWITVPESEAGSLQRGTEVEVAIDSRPELGRLASSVKEVVPMADPATHSVSVRLSLPDDGLRPGITGKAWLPAGEHPSLRVPESAIYRSGGLALVCVVDAQGLARSRAVSLGDSHDGLVDVLAGLDAGQRVVAQLTQLIPEGTPIRESAE